MAHIKKRERADERDKLLVPSESRRENDVPSFGERFWKTASGGTKSSASAHTNNAGNALYGEAARQRQQTSGEISAWQDTIDAYQDVLNDPLASASERDTAYNVIGDLGRRIDAYQSAYGSGGANERAAEKLWDAADRTADSAAADIARAKQGGGKATNFLVDAGVSGTQIAGDALLSPIPGASIVPMAARVMGSSSQEARRSGASFEDAMAYGGANALTEVATEKMFDGLAGVYGKGAADEIVDDVIRRASKNPNVQKALNVAASSAGESVEEVVSGALEPALKTIYNGKSAGENYSELEAGDLLYGALLGAALGGVGGAVENARDSYNGNPRLQFAEEKSTISTANRLGGVNHAYQQGAVGENQTSDTRAPTQNEGRSRLQREIQRGERAFREDDAISVWGSQQEKLTARAKEYGTSAQFESAEEWTAKAAAYTDADGIVHIRDDMPSDRFEEITNHELTHVLKRKGFQPYLDFLEELPAELDMSSLSAQKLIDAAARHRNIDLFGTLTEEQLVTLYDEINALVYGAAKSGYVEAVRNDLTDAFHDFDAYTEKLQALHEAYILENRDKSFAKRNNTISYADIMCELRPQTSQPTTPYSDELRKILDELGGFREP